MKSVKYYEIVGFPGSGKTYFMENSLNKKSYIESKNVLLRVIFKSIGIVYFMLFDFKKFRYLKSLDLRFSYKYNLVSHIGYVCLIAKLGRSEVWCDQGITQILISIGKSDQGSVNDILRILPMVDFIIVKLDIPFERCVQNWVRRGSNGTSYLMEKWEYIEYNNSVVKILRKLDNRVMKLYEITEQDNWNVFGKLIRGN